ncbi:hypothetical protein Ple7327_4452 [Pleurocapsa sp. PCC 7327]|nr:hypothetical protein Ple7327_4452 [Pleurocapsa sp. PCC 7327]
MGVEVDLVAVCSFTGYTAEQRATFKRANL